VRAPERPNEFIGAESLQTYLKDHLDRSVAAIELLSHLIAIRAESSLVQFLSVLREEIKQDQNVLKKLLEESGWEESSLKNAGVSLTEKFDRVALKLENSHRGPLGLVEALEIIALELEGKRLLWRALVVSRHDVPYFLRWDFAGLAERTRDQRDQVDARRLEAAQVALKALFKTVKADRVMAVF
jgi:hypothetical protein